MKRFSDGATEDVISPELVFEIFVCALKSVICEIWFCQENGQHWILTWLIYGGGLIWITLGRCSLTSSSNHNDHDQDDDERDDGACDDLLLAFVIGLFLVHVGEGLGGVYGAGTLFKHT